MTSPPPGPETLAAEVPRTAPSDRDARGGPTTGRFGWLKAWVRRMLPVEVRKAAARFLGRQTWFPHRHWWIHELLRDFAMQDPGAYHRFLWANHLGYAETYEVAYRFGADQIHPTRKLLFADLETCLETLGHHATDVDSVFEVGSSLGYNLRFLETGLLREVTILEGCDIDGYAVAQGNTYLRSCGSRVHVFQADMADLDARLGDRTFDISLCAGVLMYLQRPEAERVVASLLRHTGTVAVFAGLADPERDNSELDDSGVRFRDGTFIHDLDGMVRRAGGRVVQRRWEGARLVGGNTIYFVFATPAVG